MKAAAAFGLWAASTARAHFFAGRYDKAATWAEKVLLEQPDHLGTIRIAAASNALAGRLKEAHEAMARIRHLDPALRLSDLDEVMPPFRRRGPDQICGGLANSRAAGVITAAQPREKAARVSASGLVDPTLGYPARGPASWRWRSEL